MPTPIDEMQRRRTAAQSRLATAPPSGNAPVGPATVQRWTPPAAPSAVWTPPGTAAPAPAAPATPLPTATMVRERLGAASVPELPQYRNPNGFTQTPAPVNPNPRPMATPAEVPTGPTGAAQRAPGASGRPLRPTGGKIGAGSAAALALEGLNIAGAAQRDGLRGTVTETAAAGTRLGAAKLGAELGGRLPLPGAWKGAGVALGGIAGYAGGQQIVDYARENTPPWMSKALDTLSTASDVSSNPLGGAGVVGDLGMKAGMRLMQGPNGSAPAPVPAAQMPAGRMIQGPNATAAAKLATAAPAAAATPQQNVIGTFQMQGRPERQVFADGSVTPAAAGANGAFSVIPAYQGSTTPAAARLSTPTIAGPGFADSERRQFNEQIDAQIRGLGELNMASKRRLVADLLGLKGQSVGRAFDAANGRNTAQAELAQRGNEAQLRADVDREQIAAGERSSKRSARAQTQTITAEDGTVYSIEGSTLTPLATAGGEQIKAPRKVTPNPQAEIAAKLLEGMVMPGASPQEIQAAAQQAQSAAAALLSSGTGGAQATSAPKSGEIVAGYRFNGGDPNDQKNWTKVE